MSFDTLFASSKPIIPIRALHLDLKGVPPAPARLVSLLKVAKAARYNAVCVEWEDSFPWTVDKRFRSQTAYTPAQIDAFYRAARELEIDVMPLVQCLGHMETPLAVPGYEHLREVPDRCDVLNPLAPGAGELIQKMVDDVLSGMPKPRWFHLGGDEAWSFGTHPDTKAYIAAHGKGALYLKHVEPILDSLNARGIRPILWHDMMREWDEKALKALAAKADLCVWGYTGHPFRDMGHHVTAEIVERFGRCGVQMWGGSAYKGGDGHDTDLPNLVARRANAIGWADVAPKHNMKGVIVTAWSRYSTTDVQCDPIDGALDALVEHGVILHDGREPKGGDEAVAAALDGIGEKRRFEACKKALYNLTEGRKAWWYQMAHLHETIAMARIDRRRSRAGLVIKRLITLRKAVADCKAAGEETRTALAGLLEPFWIDSYLAERLAMIKELYPPIEAAVKELSPEEYAALPRL